MPSDCQKVIATSDGGVDESALSLLLCESMLPLDSSAARHAGLRSRLLRRVRESARRHAGLITIRADDGTWLAVKAGIRAKLLREGPHGASALIEFAPAATLPAHRHHYLEEGIVLRGRLQLGDLDLLPGDYHVSPPGSRHDRISSREGGLAYLRGTSLGNTTAVLGEVLGGLLPGNGPPFHTVFAREDSWERVAEGVEQKILWRDDDVISRLVRLAAGGRLPAHVHDGEEECIMLSGDAFFGDLLVQAGDFHLAPPGSEHGVTTTDGGALAFLRGREILPLPSRP
jgi:quercetin dioxygenase-like cupin family protein